MATWKNLDTLASYSKLNSLKDHVNIAEAMSGEQGAERVKKYSVPMAAGLLTITQLRKWTRPFLTHFPNWLMRQN